MSTILSIQNISKTYGTVRALHDVTFSIPKGSVFGILGPNGSGKTTLLGILLDVLKADSGSFEWHQPTTELNARQQIGALLETPNFYHYLSAGDNLKINAKIKTRGEDEIDSVLKRVNLFQRKDSEFKTFSLGMKQRLAIASCLLGSPEILVFDEPTNGLDPVGITEIRDLIRELHGEGYTIIMASHLLDEVEKICSHVAILKFGQLLSVGPVDDVLKDTPWIELSCSDNARLLQVLHNFPYMAEVKNDGYVLLQTSKEIELDEINKYCFDHGVTLQHLNKRKRSLESKFMELTRE